MASLLHLFHCSTCKENHLLHQWRNTNNKLSNNNFFKSRISFPSHHYPCFRITCRSSSSSGGGVSSLEREEEKNMGKSRQGRGKVQLKVRLNHQVKFGEHVSLLGSSREFGSWKKKVEMNWTENGWASEVESKGGATVEFKFVIVGHNKSLVWEGGDNRVFKLPEGGKFEMVCHWNKTKEALNLLPLGSVESSGTVGSSSKNGSTVGDAAPTKEAADGGASPFVEQWQGRTASFMQSNDHGNRETGRRWDTTGLEGLVLMMMMRGRKMMEVGE